MTRLWEKSWPKGVKMHLECPEISIPRLFEQKVNENPNLPYLNILGMDFTMTYINDMANRFAAALQAKGIGIGDRVGLFMPNLPQFVFSFMGILKSGATVVPISPLYGESDLQKTLQDSEIIAIVALDIVYANLGKVRSTVPKLKYVITTSLGDILSPVKRFLATLLKK